MNQMLSSCIISLFILVLITDAFPEASIGMPEVNTAKKRCPGGYTESTQVVLGRYWYECRDGDLVPKGCIADDGRRIEILQTYDITNYRMQCIVDSRGYLAFTYKSCLYDGREHGSNEVWEDGKYWYTCVKDGDYLHIIVSGCIDEGRRVDINTKVTKGSFVYQCKKTSNGTCSMCPVACTKNGREYAIGESFQVGDFWYTCTNTDSSGPITIKIIGCINNGERLKDGDRYWKNDVVYECSVRADIAEVKPVGCVQRGDNGALVERRLDCYWNEGPVPYQFEMTCKYDKDTNTAVKVRHRCMYKIAQGAYTIDPGCYQVVEKSAISCEKDSADSMNMRVYQVDDIGMLTAKGLRFC